ncbi:T9SS type A sorting domain-containing protein [Lunatimonas sp.]|uniref:T9SS type A sorting domain-containing protein n=1 Tax=Lunatimonas sp. TaxID=2060141 RepID=UPI00344D2A66
MQLLCIYGLSESRFRSHPCTDGKRRGEASADRAGYYTIGIYDEGGNLIWEKETESREEYIPVAGWKSGIYHVRIQHPEGNFAQKVIVRH